MIRKVYHSTYKHIATYDDASCIVEYGKNHNPFCLSVEKQRMVAGDKTACGLCTVRFTDDVDFTFMMVSFEAAKRYAEYLVANLGYRWSMYTDFPEPNCIDRVTYYADPN